MTKKTRMILTAALAVSAMASAAWAQPAGSPVAKHGALKVVGNKIVDKNGEPVALRGMSFYWDRADWNGHQFYTAGAVNTLADEWKVDVVRAAYSAGQGQSDKLRTVIDAAIAKGIYVIIDWHSHNAHNEQTAATSFFQGHAEAYKNTPNVIFEIYNEPDTKQNPCTWSQVKTYANSVVSAIRGKSANNIILIGSRDYSKRVDEATADPVTGTNLAYTVHYYTAEPGTEHQNTLRSMCNTALNRGFALFVSEWGVTEADGGEKNPSVTDVNEAKTWFEYLDRNSIGWANWSVTAFEGSSALSSGSGDGTGWVTRNPGGTFVRQSLIDYATKTWTVTATKSGNGTVTANSPGPAYPHGSMVTLTATADPGWVFERWGGTDGADLGTRNPSTFTKPLYGNKSVQAIFGQGSMVKNGTFTVNISEWAGSGITLAYDDGTLKATVTGSTAFVRQTGLSLEANKKYALSFRAKASSGTVAVTPRITNASGTNHWEGSPVSLTASWKTENVEFCMPATDANAQIRFQSNNASGAVWNLDDVKLDEVGVGNCATGIPDSCDLPNPKPSCANYCQAYPSAAQCQPDTCALPNPRPGCANYCQVNPTAAQCQTDSCETNPEKCVGVVLPNGMKAQRAVWSVSRAGGSLQLRGPAEAGARVSLYDIRGKLVRSMTAVDGLTLGTGIPAGSYVLVVKSRVGGEVLKTRVVLAK